MSHFDFSALSVLSVPFSAPRVGHGEIVLTLHDIEIISEEEAQILRELQSLDSVEAQLSALKGEVR